MGLAMKLFLLLVLLNAAMVKNINGEKHEVLLNGFTVEATHLPLVLKCDASFSHILLGSITIDSKQADEKLIKDAEKECKKTQEILSTGPAAERLRCSVELAGATNLTGNEYFRVVYQCYKDVPHNWEEEKFKTASQKKAGKYLDMKSKEKAMFKVTSVKINGAQANTQKFPELKNDAIERECYMQIVKQMAETSNKKNYKCAILNKAEYGGTLEITYWWDIPPMDKHNHPH